MKRIAPLILVLAFGFVIASGLAAQGTTASMLDSAKTFYQQLEIERSLPILRNIISPASPYEVTRAQRVDAYKYLGASFAVQGKADSASMFFRAAIERDPFTDLDPTVFAPAEIQAFGAARRQTFAVGVSELASVTLDPRTDRLRLRVVTTHAAELEVAIRSVAGASGVSLYSGPNDGIRDIDWSGLVTGGQLASEGRYELLVAGTSEVTGRADTAVAYFDATHSRPPLEDTLPGLRAEELLREQYPASAASLELLKGLGIGAAAVLVPTALGSSTLGRGLDIASGTIVGAGVFTGVVSFFMRQSNRAIPQNIQANQERRAARATVNAEIRARNEARIRETRLVIAPVAGAVQ